MKDYDNIKFALKCLPPTLALQRIKDKRATTTDYRLIASIVTHSYVAPFLATFDKGRQIVKILTDYDWSRNVYNRVLCFHLPDVFDVRPLVSPQTFSLAEKYKRQ